MRVCIDGADEADCLAGHLRAWRFSGVPPESIAVFAGRMEVAEALLAKARARGAPTNAVRVGEVGWTSAQDLRALALVGCDTRFSRAQPEGDFGDRGSDLARIRSLLHIVGAPRDHLVISWRGRPEPLFGDLDTE